MVYVQPVDCERNYMHHINIDYSSLLHSEIFHLKNILLMGLPPPPPNTHTYLQESHSQACCFCTEGCDRKKALWWKLLIFVHVDK